MFSNYFKTAWRNLVKNKIFSFINIVGLSLGLACAILIGLWVNDEIQFDKFHTNDSQLYRVMANLNWGSERTGDNIPAPLNEAMKKDFPEIQYVSTVSADEILFFPGPKAHKEKGYYTTPDFLKMFSFPLEKGDVNAALSSKKNIVISQRLAEKYFGNEDPIGKTITVNQSDVFQVSGVLKTIPTNSSLRFDWLIPFDVYVDKNQWLKTWGNYSVYMYVMLAPQASARKVNEKLLHVLTKYNSGTKDEIFLQPFGDKYLYGDFKAGKQEGGRIVYVRLFSIIAAFVLIIACINFMNLTTARSVKRAKEVGIRKVVGAERRMIIAQFFGEALLLTICAVCLALIIVELLMPAFNQLTQKQLDINFSNAGFILAILAITIFTGILAGSYPALFLSSFRPVAVLKSVSVKTQGASTLRKGLVIFQFSLSIILIIGTIIIYNQINFIRNRNLGLDKNNMIVMLAEGNVFTHLNTFEDELSRAKGVANVTTAGDNPLSIDGTSADLKWPGKRPDEVASVSATFVGYNFLKTMNIPLIAGRDFSKDMADSSNYVINESAARLMNLKNPVGQQIEFWSGKGTIVGVTRDFHLHSLHQPITPLVLCLQPLNSYVIFVKPEQGKTQEAIASLNKLQHAYDASYPFEYHFLDEMYEEKYKGEMMIGKLVNAFALMAIIISCLGLFGLATYMAEQRIKEIGIRKVLGASVTNITGLLTLDFLKLVFIAALIAFPVAWFGMSKWLENYAYHVNIAWWVFALAGALAIIIALFTIGYQAIRAALTNPVKNLRTE
ncbi:MAG TPA: ABC transporter permease [Puia sp.]|nr:ABC transporter permease [Puia sp.]